jgi:hypothetical protein
MRTGTFKEDLRLFAAEAPVYPLQERYRELLRGEIAHTEEGIREGDVIMASENCCPQCGVKLPANAPQGLCP